MRQLAGKLSRAFLSQSSLSSPLVRTQLQSINLASARSISPFFASRAFSSSLVSRSDSPASNKSSNGSFPPPPQNSNSSSSDSQNDDPFTASLNDILAKTDSLPSVQTAYNSRRSSNFGANFSRVSRNQNNKELDIADILKSTGVRSTRGSDLMSGQLPPDVNQQIPYPTLNSSTGRSYAVDQSKGIDLAKAMQKLNSTLARNMVRSDFNKQRFHERPGLKRKRLKSQRWRRRFKAGFAYVTNRVEKLRKMGW